MLRKTLLSFFVFTFSALMFMVIIDNHHQYLNIDKILNQNLDGKLIPHKADYINKLKNILSDRIRSFEFDTLFNDNAMTPYFEVGHDISDMHGVSFESYLKLARGKHIVKIWMDIKNINRNNVDDVLRRLNYLDKKYDIKDILIFETSSTLPEVRKISDEGYHTSYYLPSDVLSSVAKMSMPDMVNEARRIKRQIELQHLKAISFPNILYWFVKSCVEPIISGNIVYHTWGGYRLRKKDELSYIQHENIYNDDRIKTIIYTYYNNKLNRLYSF
jgi:hypothetical protein